VANVGGQLQGLAREVSDTVFGAVQAQIVLSALAEVSAWDVCTRCDHQVKRVAD